MIYIQDQNTLISHPYLFSLPVITSQTCNRWHDCFQFHEIWFFLWRHINATPRRTYGLAKSGLKTQPKLASIVCAALGTISTNCKTVRSAGNLHKSCSEWSRSLMSETWPKQGHCVRRRIHMALSLCLSAGVTSIHSFIHSCQFKNRAGRVLGWTCPPPDTRESGECKFKL